MKKLFSSYVLCLVCSLFIFSSCAKSFKKIIEETEPATFIVYTYDEFGTPSGSGSGFFIESDGVGVTNWHVLDNSIKAVIKTSDKKQYEIDTVLCASSQKDILVFRIKNTNNERFKTISFSKTKPEKGCPVYNIGAPLGMESTCSEGIVSSYREDSHGEIVQTTTPISPGSSGSPLLTEKGDVFAIATFKRKGGENMNFGVIISENFREDLDEKEFYKKNRKFNSGKSEFILLNILPDRGSDIVLNAIEFGPSATTLYMSFTNMHLSSRGQSGWYLWCEMGKKDKGFYIEDKDTKQRYYVTSSSLASTKEKAEPIGLAKVLQFKVNFPVIKKKLSNIDIMWGEGDRSSHFTNIDLDQYRNNLSVDDLGYKRAYALQCTTEDGDFVSTIALLNEILEENPADVISLNMMAIISYVLENNTDAMLYLEDAIEQNPNDELAYFNRSSMYEIANNYQAAIEDISSAINLVPEQPDYYWARAWDYYVLNEYDKALIDLNKCLEVSSDEDGFKDNAYFYEQRGYVYAYLGDFAHARLDCQKSYRLSKDADLDKRLQRFWKQIR